MAQDEVRTLVVQHEVLSVMYKLTLYEDEKLHYPLLSLNILFCRAFPPSSYAITSLASRFWPISKVAKSYVIWT
jgi:hypothetical protein